MHRQQLEHIIRPAAGITGATEFVIIGSQAVLGQFPQAPDELLVSIAADVFSLRDPADSDLIDGSIGWNRVRLKMYGFKVEARLRIGHHKLILFDLHNSQHHKVLRSFLSVYNKLIRVFWFQELFWKDLKLFSNHS